MLGDGRKPFRDKFFTIVMDTSSDHRVLITGGAGFIGAHLLLHMLRSYPDYKFYNLDVLTYASDLRRLSEIEEIKNYYFLKADISEKSTVDKLFEKYRFTSVIHLAAESHVDRSITDPGPFVSSNIVGTLHLLEAARRCWQPLRPENRFYQISTDEVYGTLGRTGVFTEESPYRPRSPYAATKASADHLLRAYSKTYKLPVLLSHSCNNYGPFQYPEKLIPLALLHLLERRAVPLYGKGEQIREWIYVEDHIRAVDLIFHKGKIGETYHIGSNERHSNLTLLDMLIHALSARNMGDSSKLHALVQFVKDRPGHDFRYALAGKKIQNELGWQPTINLKEGLDRTIDWYLNNSNWVDHIRSKDYEAYYKQQYGTRI